MRVATLHRAKLTIFWIFICWSAILGIVKSVGSLEQEQSYRKDLLQEYVMAKAISVGQNPYQPIAGLAEKFVNLPVAYKAIFPHPSPHPPTLLPYINWFAEFNYQQVAIAWFLFSLVLLAIVSIQLSKNENPSKTAFFICMLIASSHSLYLDLVLGQLNLYILFFFLMFLRAFENKNSFLMGLWLGICMSIKFFGIPIFLVLLIKKRFFEILVALTTLACSFLFALGLIGLERIFFYFQDVIPNISRLYVADEYNQSLWTVGQRIFVGLSSSTVEISPLFDQPNLAAPFAYLMLCVLFFGAVYVFRLCDESRNLYCYAAGISVLISPVVWTHSYLLLFPLLFNCWFEREKIFYEIWQCPLFLFLCALLWIIPKFREFLISEYAILSAWYQPLMVGLLLPAMLLLLHIGYVLILNSKRIVSFRPQAVQ